MEINKGETKVKDVSNKYQKAIVLISFNSPMGKLKCLMYIYSKYNN
jgi:hypothetical protein